MTSTKNANRTTVIKGIIANPNAERMEDAFKEFMVTTAYTRSLSKAVDFAREALNLDDSVMLTVSELVNEPLKKAVYDPASVENYALHFSADEENEKLFAETQENVTVIKYHVYAYTAQVWFYDEIEDKYQTHFYADESALKFGVVDTREFIKMGASDFYELQVIGIHNAKRGEEIRFAVVPNDKLELCERKDS